MKFNREQKTFINPAVIGLYQEGGEIVEGTPAPIEEGQDPLQQLVMVAQQALEEQNCEAAMMVAEGLLALAGGGAPEEAPVAADGGEMGYKQGGNIDIEMNKSRGTYVK